ncbi:MULTISPECIES: RNA-binding cell elongation regulator Jag/EloR [unclassified Paenibacillus]|uniref:RNA-binding cell elongation regulator Jag/EloR n=1 Tax=unclassified Paenibacillus TaxID=185978 RepID=UPI00104BB794|nr:MULTISPECIES: RNA-binding cell elongation regulator Jag/EloR [unclassified Paenibacillus]NIK71479.1 spoIIIJ-associated protein [Paenibacillus sp. BK720]TCM96804.1 spoIIIJ-associated protein [Paenibacillus sp. BK033]
MKKIVASGKTIDDAVRSGLTHLNVTKDRVKVLVMEQPSKGLFGLIGVKEAKVELELIPDPTIEAEQFLRDVSEAMGLTIAIERKTTKEATYLSVSGGGDIGMLIGRRGQTLDALQYLVNIVANRYSDSHLRIVLDAEDFRERRRKTLEELSERLAGRVVRTKKEVVLEPMSSHERKVIHSQLQNHPRVKTYSKGDEPNRRVVIALKEKQM